MPIVQFENLIYLSCLLEYRGNIISAALNGSDRVLLYNVLLHCNYMDVRTQMARSITYETEPGF